MNLLADFLKFTTIILILAIIAVCLRNFVIRLRGNSSTPKNTPPVYTMPHPSIPRDTQTKQPVTIDQRPKVESPGLATKPKSSHLTWTEDLPFELNDAEIFDAGQQARIYKTTFAGELCAIKVFNNDENLSPTLHARCAEITERLNSPDAPPPLRTASIALGSYHISASALHLPTPSHGFYDALVYRWISGSKPLYEWLSTNPDKGARKRVFFDILHTLDFLDKRGIISLDVYPENWLVTDAGEVHLIDLESSGLLDKGGTWLFPPAVVLRDNSWIPLPPDYASFDLGGRPAFRWLGIALLTYVDLDQHGPLFFLNTSDESFNAFSTLSNQNAITEVWPPFYIDNLHKRFLTTSLDASTLQKMCREPSAIGLGDRNWGRILYSTFTGLMRHTTRPSFSEIIAFLE